MARKTVHLWRVFFCLGLLLAGPAAAQTMFTEVPIDVPLSPSRRSTAPFYPVT